MWGIEVGGSVGGGWEGDSSCYFTEQQTTPIAMQ